jgi:hypothetical protein
LLPVFFCCVEWRDTSRDTSLDTSLGARPDPIQLRK